MNTYEQVLNKISPVFYKFVSYSHYFLNKKLEIKKFINYDLDAIRGYSSNEVSYSFITNFDWVDISEWYFIISLKKSNEFMLDELFGFVGFITTMVINNFSFKNMKLVDNAKPLYLFPPAIDLFIRLVGKDTYETIRRNIK